MPQILFLSIVLFCMGALVGSGNTTAYTDLNDYEMASGLCVNNGGVQYMSINSVLNADDYLETVHCDDGAIFELNEPGT